MRVLDPRLSAGKRANVQSNMLGPQVLDAAKYPRIEFRSTSIENRANGVLHVDGNLELHGQTRPISFDAAPGENGAFTGSANVRQTDFGITPIRIAGGAVSVRDDVRVEFTIQFIGGSAASRSLGRSHATIATHGEKRWLRLRR
jgi:polyisoprenoid-binding protein YceI